MTAIAFSSVLSPLPLDVVITERHTAELDITEIPIENGSRITDHAFVLPKKLTLEAASANATAAYNALVAVQESRLPFVIVTGLYVYTNMLIKTIQAERDAQYSAILKCTADLQEILIVSTAYAADPFAGDSNATNSTSSKLSPVTAGDPATADRLQGPVNRGDTSAITQNATSTSSLLGQVVQ